MALVSVEKFEHHAAPSGFVLHTSRLTYTQAISACAENGMQLVKDDSYAKHASIQIYLVIIAGLQRYVTDMIR